MHYVYRFHCAYRPDADQCSQVVQSIWFAGRAGLQFAKAQSGSNPASPASQTGSSGPAWTSLGPKGLGILSLAINPSAPATLYAGQMGSGGNGVYQSIDSGGNWQQINNGLSNPDIRAITRSKNTGHPLYGEQLRSIQNHRRGSELEQCWHRPDHSTILSLAVDPSTPATLYAGTYGGTFKSTDGGAHWSGINNGLVSNFVYTLAVDPGKPATLYAGTYMGVYKSTNGGDTWSPANDGMADAWVFALAFDPNTSTTIYAGTDEGVYKTMDGGVHWTAINSGLTSLDIQALAVDPEKSIHPLCWHL